MDGRARTPEELETLLEDAYVLRDAKAVALLHEQGALVARRPELQARGREEIARAAADSWQRGATFVAEPCQVLQAGTTALIIGARAVSVARLAPGGAWRYAIVRLEPKEGEA